MDFGGRGWSCLEDFAARESQEPRRHFGASNGRFESSGLARVVVFFPLFFASLGRAIYMLIDKLEDLRRLWQVIICPVSDLASLVVALLNAPARYRGCQLTACQPRLPPFILWHGNDKRAALSIQFISLLLPARSITINHKEAQLADVNLGLVCTSQSIFNPITRVKE